ncbi:MAG: transporter substrate-binding domain-containing protein [Bacteroidales bacterium]|nr:transporter substrate-binding domain-containing protein [Bacteroidales bacterium]MCF8326672.1 transporter substrate-binding domain-containing protein [Bacteroidales bacterium]
MNIFFDKYKKPIAIALFSLILIIVVIFSFNTGNQDEEYEMSPADTVKAEQLKKILKEDKLVAITDYNSINYFVYRGKTMGYQYELLQKYADYLEVELDIKVDNSMSNKFRCLNQGECDIIGIDLTVTEERSKFVDFTVPHSLSRQVLVQRKPEGYRRMTSRSIEEELIRNQLNLDGKTVYVQKGSSFASRLESLSNEIGGDINIIESDYEAEHLVKLVAQGEIDYTVCDEHVAMVNSTYYDNIDIETPVSFPQKLAWAVKKGADSLRLSINEWLRDYKETADYRMLYHKYFVSSRSSHKRNQEFHSISGGKISRYDDLIKKYSDEIGWDWRLLASLVYQESRFNPKIDSWAGAQGLMQLMPNTARRFGANNVYDPEQNIRAGVKFLEYLEKQFEKKQAEKEDRIRFVLASYNVGLGHVLDARRLAHKYEADTNSWNAVDTFLLYKSMPKYYNDPVVKHGYCRGEETYNFVNQILDRYEHYKNLVPE